jgi:hypothetical protein
MKPELERLRNVYNGFARAGAKEYMLEVVRKRLGSKEGAPA